MCRVLSSVCMCVCMLMCWVLVYEGYGFCIGYELLGIPSRIAGQLVHAHGAHTLNTLTRDRCTHGVCHQILNWAHNYTDPRLHHELKSSNPYHFSFSGQPEVANFQR